MRYSEPYLAGAGALTSRACMSLDLEHPCKCAITAGCPLAIGSDKDT